MKTKIFLSMIMCVALMAGCATVPTELIDARKAFADASNGPAAQKAPTELRKAKEALAKAEDSFARRPKSYETRDLAYAAQRRAQLAEVSAATAMAKEEAAKASKDYLAAQEEVIKGEKLKLEQEKQRLAQMQLELAKLAMVKQEARGLVITLSGSVLFASGQSTLLPAAQRRLDQVTASLLETKDQRLLVEGHTDSLGSDSYNLDLSLRRAEAVRSYLISKGYSDLLIEAKGIGEVRPVASNRSAEGRANNRRVEIVILPTSSSKQ